MAQYLAIKVDSTSTILKANEGKDISTFVTAVRHAISSTEALNQATDSSLPLHDGSVLEGSTWVKTKECGGSFTNEYLFCSFNNQLILGDNVDFKTSIENDGVIVKAIITIANPDGYGFYGSADPLQSCEIGWNAKARDGLASGDSALSTYDCDKQTGVITIKLNFSSDNAEYLNRHGKNSPTAAIDWDHQNLNNVNELTTSLIKDADDDGFYIDMNGSSVMNSAKINNIDSTTLKTQDLTVSSSFSQTDATKLNSIAGGLSIGNSTDKVSVENGSIYLSGAIVSETDNSYFLDPKVSRVQDFRLTSRGGVKVSALLPKYVNEGAVTINGQGVVNKIDCPEVGVNNLRIVVNWQDAVDSIAKEQQIISNQTKKRIRISQNATQYAVQMLSYDLDTLAWKAFPENRGLVTLFCYYP